MSVLPIRLRAAAWAAPLVLCLAGRLAADPVAAAQAPPDVHAQFISGAGEAGVQSVQMFLDGKDVSAEARASALRVVYTPTENLSPGIHAARVVVIDSLGRSFVKEWTFEVIAPAPEPEVAIFFSESLAIELDAVPRRVRASSLRISGLTRPGAEVAVRVDGSLSDRVLADMRGRFVVVLDLAAGENDVRLAASRLDTGDEGSEVARRVERIVPRSAFVLPRPRLDLPVASPAVAVDQRPVLEAIEPVIVERPDPPAQRERVRDESPASRALVPGVEPVVIEPMPPEVVITKPNDGETLRADHVTVLGRAPAGWRVTLLVDSQASGADTANPAGHFTIPNVHVGAGDHELIAEAASPSGIVVQSRSVRIEGHAGLTAQRVAILLPSRTSTIVRGRTLRVEGTAWDGAEVEVEVNGRVVATEIAAVSGRFALDVPLADGSNLVAIETHARDGSRFVRSPTYFVTAQGGQGARVMVPDPVGRSRSEVRRVRLPGGEARPIGP